MNVSSRPRVHFSGGVQKFCNVEAAWSIYILFQFHGEVIGEQIVGQPDFCTCHSSFTRT